MAAAPRKHFWSGYKNARRIATNRSRWLRSLGSSMRSRPGARRHNRILGAIRKPVLIANGDQDKMVPSSNSIDLARRLPNAELVLYEDAGHGGIFQYHEAFVKKTLEFFAR
ncbi:alpha/beta fold hydrolase [Mesorhizobium sp. AaZ16]|uniref:alpha/beta fold hydrolase n=1 Tax=Mesorhizobium sp. AaZ16 TaxID=3402289 RepID=UPI00374ED94C